MSRIARLAVLATALASLSAVLTSSAGAVTWHNSGDTAYTAAAGAGTLSVTGVSMACTTSSATGTSPAGSVVGTTYVTSGTASFSGCSLSGIPTTTSCSYTSTGTSQSGGVTSGVMDVLCSVSQFGTEICKIEGQAPGSYTNPVNPSTFGKVSFAHASTLRTTNGTGGSCPLGVGEPATTTAGVGTITSATGGSTTPHLGPRITRTA